MRKFITLLFVACLWTGKSTAQQFDGITKGDIVFSIIQAEIDGQDHSYIHVLSEAYLVLYIRDNVPYFANVWQKAESQSYGEISTLYYEDSTQGKIYNSWLWSYQNSYDDKRGTAIIHLTLTESPIATSFEVRIITENAEMMIYKGYLNDSLSWEPYY